MTARPTDVAIALAAAPGISRAAACRLAARLGTWQAAGWGGAPRIAARLGVPPAELEAAAELARNAPALARRERRRAVAAGARIVTVGEAGYPEGLEDLELPPPALWIRGADPPGPGRSVAMVGSRQADPYGREVARLFARELAAAGLTVVSGFARGIDATAHRGALEWAEAQQQNGAPAGCATVAVLGAGLEVDYPRTHRRLGERITAAGSLVSEFPCGLEPRPWHFPVRNRLIAALAAGVIVVRAAPRSGSLITARLALDLGREVFAVPGNIFDRRSAGPNALVADGAHPSLLPRDVLEVLGVSPGATEAPTGPDGGEAGAAAESERLPPGVGGRVLATMTPGEPVSPEAVAGALGEGVDRVLGALLELELEGRVRREPGAAYTRRP
ncbi:MAG: DNA-processing protein DprA [Thermoanaerobaculia bacterium]